MLFLGANLIECLTTAAWISNPQPPGAHLSHNDNADLSARKPRESEDRHPVDVEHLEVLGGAEIPDLVSGTGGLRGASPASSGFRRTQYVAGRVVSSRAKVRASTNQCRAHRDAGPRGLSRATGVTAPVPPLLARRWARRRTWRPPAFPPRTHALQRNHVIVLCQDPFIPFGLERQHRGYRECREGSPGSDAGSCPRPAPTDGLVRLH